MPPISLLIKPASGSCNMRCQYCFYTDEMCNRNVSSYGIMNPDTLESVIRKALGYAKGRASFCFQGGEPTLVGLDFFERVIYLQNKYRNLGTQVHNAIQTNGLLINRQWADFLAKNHVLTGLSLDGPKDIHDINRVDAEGKGTFQRILSTAQLLASRKAEFNILTVVTADVASHVGRVYGFFRKNNLLYQQYIPCLDPMEKPRGGNRYSLTPDLYAKFLTDLLQLWYIDKMNGRFIHIRYFDNLLMMMMGRQPESCGMSGRCVNQLVVEADGSVYPCDFYVLDQWRLGNLFTDPIEEIISNPLAQRFISESLLPHENCNTCECRLLCRGGCRRDRVVQGDGTSLNYFCDTMKVFFRYAIPKLHDVLNKA